MYLRAVAKFTEHSYVLYINSCSLCRYKQTRRGRKHDNKRRLNERATFGNLARSARRYLSPRRVCAALSEIARRICRYLDSLWNYIIKFAYARADLFRRCVSDTCVLFARLSEVWASSLEIIRGQSLAPTNRLSFNFDNFRPISDCTHEFSSIVPVAIQIVCTVYSRDKRRHCFPHDVICLVFYADKFFARVYGRREEGAECFSVGKTLSSFCFLPPRVRPIRRAISGWRPFIPT